jgi:hypothetical protein
MATTFEGKDNFGTVATPLDLSRQGFCQLRPRMSISSSAPPTASKFIRRVGHERFERRLAFTHPKSGRHAVANAEQQRFPTDLRLC